MSGGRIFQEGGIDITTALVHLTFMTEPIMNELQLSMRESGRR